MMRRLRGILAVALWPLLLVAGIYQSHVIYAAQQTATAPVTSPDLKLPLEKGSTRFAVIGDSGTGDREQNEIAQRMLSFQDQVKFDFVIMLGDNIYGGHSASDFARKFEQPYKPLLDRGVKFYASLGNHDDPNVERQYKPFNMNGQRYYKFKRGDIAFFVLDSNYMDPAQLTWIEEQLRDSGEKWKIAYFHHPLFNAGKHHGADVDLRAQLMPLFKKYGVNAVFSGHEHVYERLKPVNDIYFFVLGSSGKLMTNDFRSTAELDDSFDSDQTFMLVEVAGDQLHFQVISRQGRTIDSGTYSRQAPLPKTNTASASN
jgi:3',5'-cyclic AMP phosphodiesterase CpdA